MRLTALACNTPFLGPSETGKSHLAQAIGGVATQQISRCPPTHESGVRIERSRACNTDAFKFCTRTGSSFAKHAFDLLNRTSKSFFRCCGAPEASDNHAFFCHCANCNLTAADVDRPDDLLFTQHFPPLSSTLFPLAILNDNGLNNWFYRLTSRFPGFTAYPFSTTCSRSASK
jgi:hypothetical protein